MLPANPAGAHASTVRACGIGTGDSLSTCARRAADPVDHARGLKSSEATVAPGETVAKDV